ncbi:Yellow 2, partial [Operophtera brumata]
IALAPGSGCRTAYFHPLISTQEFSVSTCTLNNRTAHLDPDYWTRYSIVGERGSNSQSTMHDLHSSGVMFYADIGADGVACWNTRRPLDSATFSMLASDQKLMSYPAGNMSYPAGSMSYPRLAVHFPHDIQCVSDLHVTGDEVWVIFNTLPANMPKIDEIKPVKPPPRPRPGSKRFLSSVLTILSKSTTGTQHPASINENNEKKDQIQKKPKKSPVDTYIEKEKKKKRNIKSHLNDNKHPTDEFKLLESKRAVSQKPSLYSYKDDMNLYDLPRLVKPENDEAIVNKLNNLIREVTEGRKAIERKNMVVDQDPAATLVSEHTTDKKLYNFFIDLLQTTIDVNNDKAEEDAAPEISAASSKIELEMGESVARKLNVTTEMVDDVTHKPSKHSCCLINDKERWNDQQITDYIKSTPTFMPLQNDLPLQFPSKRQRIKSESVAYTNKKKKIAPYSQSVVLTQRKSFYRKRQKKDLLNLLKEQLRMDDLSFEEPQSLYQALKVIAKTKRKNKTISFDRSTKGYANRREGYRPPECMLKRRNVVFSRKKSSSSYESQYDIGSIAKKLSEISASKRKYTSKKNPAEEPSNHSLEVYSYDYQPPYGNRSAKEPKRMELVMTYHSSASESDYQLSDKFVGRIGSTLLNY